MSSSSQDPIRLALIGAGIFARDAHLPSLLKHTDRFEIVAIYSRTREAAAALAEELPNPVDLYTDLDPLLAREDIEAVDIILPIAVLPGFVERALRAGKHVLSEKPIAPDTAVAQDLFAVHDARPGGQSVWMVGENWRYEASHVQAAELIQQGAIGEPLTCHWAIYSPVNANNKYYHTPWRRNSSFPGGFLLDGGVHHMAAMRLLLGDIVEVSARTRQISPDLPPLDTITATLQFANGVMGAYLATFANPAPWPNYLYIGGSQGALCVQRHAVELTQGEQTERIECTGFQGVELELVAFADAIRSGTPHRNTPQEALRDLAVVEALLDSGETGQRVSPRAVASM